MHACTFKTINKLKEEHLNQILLTFLLINWKQRRKKSERCTSNHLHKAFPVLKRPLPCHPCSKIGEQKSRQDRKHFSLSLNTYRIELFCFSYVINSQFEMANEIFSPIPRISIDVCIEVELVDARFNCRKNSGCDI